MRGQTHMTAALAAALASIKFGLIALLPFTIGHGFISLAVFGALIPDIDNPKSTLGRRLMGTSTVINNVFGHRGLFHSIFGAGIMVALIFLLSTFLNKFSFLPTWEAIAIPVTLGYVVHIITDGFTPQGVRIFHPIQRLHLRGPIKTGSFLENIFFIGLIFLSGFIIGEMGTSIFGYI